jgi:ribonuclease P protein component
VAFALGRALGPAVTRNRLRRQLRALCRDLDQRSELPPGLLLIGAKPAATELTFDQLEMELRSMVRQLTDGSRP